MCTLNVRNFDGGILVEFPFHQNRIRAEIHILLTLHEPAHDLGHLGMDQRFTARNTDDGRRAFVGRSPTLRRGQPLIQDMIRILNLAAPRAGEVATKQGLEHEHERIPFDPPEFLGQHVLGHCIHLGDWNSHPSLLFW
jgi:hypothetical protein